MAENQHISETLIKSKVVGSAPFLRFNMTWFGSYDNDNIKLSSMLKGFLVIESHGLSQQIHTLLKAFATAEGSLFCRRQSLLPKAVPN